MTSIASDEGSQDAAPLGRADFALEDEDRACAPPNAGAKGLGGGDSSDILEIRNSR